MFEAYDWVAIKADVEFGGTDQEFNLLQGRRLQKAYGQEPQDIFTTKLLLGLDGRKMSKTFGNAVNLLDSPEDKYGKIMSLRDDLIPQYFELATDTVMPQEKNPRDAKMRLAREIVTLYHGAAAAKKAEEAVVRQFQKHEEPTEMKLVKAGKDRMTVLEMVLACAFASSKSEARRLISQGGIKVGGVVMTDPEKMILLPNKVQKGKRYYAKVVPY